MEPARHAKPITPILALTPGSPLAPPPPLSQPTPCPNLTLTLALTPPLSRYDTLELHFDIPTDLGGREGGKDYVDTLLSFSDALGADYSGQVSTLPVPVPLPLPLPLPLTLTRTQSPTLNPHPKPYP